MQQQTSECNAKCLQDIFLIYARLAASQYKTERLLLWNREPMQWSDMLHALSGRLCYGLTTGKCQWIRMLKSGLTGKVILPDVVWHVFSVVSGGYNKVREGGRRGEERRGEGGLLSSPDHHPPPQLDCCTPRPCSFSKYDLVRYTLMEKIIRMRCSKSSEASE